MNKLVNAYLQSKVYRENLKDIYMDLVSVRVLLWTLSMNRIWK